MAFPRGIEEWNLEIGGGSGSKHIADDVSDEVLDDDLDELYPGRPFKKLKTVGEDEEDEQLGISSPEDLDSRPRLRRPLEDVCLPTGSGSERENTESDEEGEDVAEASVSEGEGDAGGDDEDVSTSERGASVQVGDDAEVSASKRGASDQEACSPRGEDTSDEGAWNSDESGSDYSGETTPSTELESVSEASGGEIDKDRILPNWNRRRFQPKVGGLPNATDIVKENDVIEPEHSCSSEEEFELYFTSDESEPSDEDALLLRPRALDLCRNKHIRKDVVVIDIKRRTERRKRKWKNLRRRQIKGRQEMAVGPRAVNEEACHYYNWFRQDHGLHLISNLEMYEVGHLMKPPRHISGIRLNLGFFEAGLRLPFDKLIVEVLNHYEKAPCQMTAQFYHTMALLIAIRGLGYEVTLDEVCAVFILKEDAAEDLGADFEEEGFKT